MTSIHVSVPVISTSVHPSVFQLRSNVACSEGNVRDCYYTRTVYSLGAISAQSGYNLGGGQTLKKGGIGSSIDGWCIQPSIVSMSSSPPRSENVPSKFPTKLRGDTDTASLVETALPMAPDNVCGVVSAAVA